MQILNQLRADMEKSRCSYCGESYDLEPCNGHHARRAEDIRRVRPNLNVSVNAVLKAN